MIEMKSEPFLENVVAKKDEETEPGAKKQNRVSVVWNRSIKEDGNDLRFSIEIDIPGADEVEAQAEAMTILVSAYARMLSKTDLFSKAGIKKDDIIRKMLIATQGLALEALGKTWRNYLEI